MLFPVYLASSTMTIANHKNIFTGTSGLVLPVPNKSFYPDAYRGKSRLTYYASLFNSIEINSSFYKVPRRATITRWRESVPREFQFTYKLWKGITHNPGLAFDPADVRDFMNTIDACGDNKGCLLVQFPGKVTIAAFPQIKKILREVIRGDQARTWRIAVEFRHPSMYDKKMVRYCRDHQLSIVAHDLPASATPLSAIEGGWVYVRFHGPEKNYRGNYTDVFLSDYAERIRAWRHEGKRVYVYFNNTLGNAVNNLITLNRLLADAACRPGVSR